LIIYPDACCYSRPFDNQEHLEIPNVRGEIAAILAIVKISKILGYSIAGSSAVTDEIGRISEAGKLKNVQDYYKETVNMHIPMSTDVRNRANWLMETLGLKLYDSYHLALAEVAGADYLLTTDLRFQRNCARKYFGGVRVVNPLTLLPEVIKWVQR